MFNGRMKGAHVTGMVACAPFRVMWEMNYEEQSI